ncbi:MarR family winged helix-turn-helix transcriptional regulator [Streptomyces sp. NPDC056144]|uniref:MarR family winged helix-turn-helix transcriptional regulator n=1 Tax=unclassified Streptomyces TaxID=2593676 RepID=UPI0035D98762
MTNTPPTPNNPSPVDTPGAADTTPRVPLPTLLAQARDLTIEQLHQQLHAEGFTHIRYRHGSVFRFIDPDGTRLTTLAERSGLTKQAIAEIVDELTHHGYTEKTPDPTDRRAKLIRLTPQGQAGQQAANRILTTMEHTWAHHYGTHTITTLRTTLEHITTHTHHQP